MGAPQQGKGQGKFNNGQNKNKGNGGQGFQGKKAEDWKKKNNQPQKHSEKPKFVKGGEAGGNKKKEEEEGKKKKKLSFGDSDGEDEEGEPELKINQKYAQAYEQRMKNQELSQCTKAFPLFLISFFISSFRSS